MKTIALSLALIAAPFTVFAHDYRVGDMTIAHPVARATTATALTSAGYLDITNTGTTADTLLEVRADFPRVMVHDTKVENGVAEMFHVGMIDIAAGETVTFAQGGKHIMFMGLNGDPFEVGETVPATLVFEHAGEIDIEFNVEDLNAAHDH